MATLIERIPWSSTAARALRVAFGGFDAEYRRQVDSGAAALWCVDGGVAYFVTRIETAKGHAPEMVVCAFAGRELHAIAPAIIHGARLLGCATIRFHTARKGLDRMTKRYGFRCIESVYQLELREVGHG